VRDVERLLRVAADEDVARDHDVFREPGRTGESEFEARAALVHHGVAFEVAVLAMRDEHARHVLRVERRLA
jgi:hypothetical protein